MIKRMEALLIFSENPRRLAEFYRDKVGLKITTEMEMGEEKEEAFALAVDGAYNIYIGPHSKVKGKNKGPERIMFNFEVDEIEGAVKELKEKGVKQIQEMYHIEDYGVISTFEDIDGNYFQLVKTE